MTTFDLICDGPGPHIPASGVLGTSDRPPRPGMRCSAAACIVPPSPEQVAAQTQDASVDALLAGAAQLLTDYAAARAALAAKITALPANATAAQLASFIKVDLAAYLVVDNDTQTKTIRGLGNFIARQTGRTNTF